MISRAKGNKGILAIVGELNTDRLNFVSVYARYFETNGMVNLARSCVYNRYRSANFSRCPNQAAIFAEFNMTRPLVYQRIVYQLMCAGVDPVQHIGGFRGINNPFTIRAHRHAFRLYSHINLRNDGSGLGIYHRHYRAVFIGDVQMAIVGV